jgi:hypothetical protein
MENVIYIFYDLLVHFADIRFILWQFGICCGNTLYYPNFGILYQEKSGNPAIESLSSTRKQLILQDGARQGLGDVTTSTIRVTG